MDSTAWDERYSGRELVWSEEPNRWVEELAAGLPPGRALDVAAGEGRNAVWLADRGWRVTATDFSPVAVERTRTVAADRLGPRADRVVAQVRDATVPPEEPGGFDLVVVSYLQLPAAQRRRALRAAAEAVAPGGHLVVVAHDSRNLTDGTGGPQDPAVLYTPADVAEDLAGTGLRVAVGETRQREVPDAARPALDVVLDAVRDPGTADGG